MSLSKFVQLVSWLLVSLPSLALSESEGESQNEQHLCQRIENYTVTSTETYNEPVVVNTFTWCLQIPPRCLKTRTEMRLRYRIKTETKERSIVECCEGYREVSLLAKTLGTMCAPFCEKCVGKCVGPNKCLCDPGFRGDDCTSPCANGTWGAECKEKCDCGQSELPCNQVSGHCHCPPGYFGPKCKRCPVGHWGLECRFRCECGHPLQKCQHETGACITENASMELSASSIPENAIEETVQIQREMISGQIEDSTRDIDVTEYTTQGCVFPCRNNESADDCDSENGGCTGNDVSIEQVASTYLRSTTEQNYVDTWKVAGEERIKESSILAETTKNSVEVSATESGFFEKSYPSATTNPVTTPTIDTNYLQMRTQEHDEMTTSTARPVIVVVSVPERRRNLDGLKFMAKNPLLRHIDENEEPRDRTPPKTDYVKTAKKEEVQASAIPLDVALIVVASLVSLGLTSMAVVMVLHMRSKLFETVRLSIYDEEKTKVQDHGGGAGGSMPQSRLSPMYSPSPEPATILTVDAIEQLSGYANGAATIGLRISGNLRDLLQDGHYDRPPATLVRLNGTEFQGGNAEHVYDEIPLQSTPLCVRKHS